MINPPTVSATPRSTNEARPLVKMSIAKTVENIGVVLTIVEVIELPMVRIPRKLSTRVTPGTNEADSDENQILADEQTCFRIQNKMSAEQEHRIRGNGYPRAPGRRAL